MLNWTLAKADCEAKGAMLFCPETEEELTVVRNHLRKGEHSLFLRFFCHFTLYAQTWYVDNIMRATFLAHNKRFYP